MTNTSTFQSKGSCYRVIRNNAYTVNDKRQIIKIKIGLYQRELLGTMNTELMMKGK